MNNRTLRSIMVLRKGGVSDEICLSALISQSADATEAAKWVMKYIEHCVYITPVVDEEKPCAE
jgi:hypothetical protein